MSHVDVKFTPEQEALIEERTNKKYNKVKDEQNNETDDSLDKIKGQNFVVVSFAGTNCKPISKDIAVKFWGAFDTYEEAEQHCKFIGRIEENRNYNIFVMSMYNWAVCPPDISKIENRIYHEEKLQSILGGHKKETIKANEIFDLRKEVSLFKPDRDVENLTEEHKKQLDRQVDGGEKIEFTSNFVQVEDVTKE
jgi:hypothetical protein